MLCQSVIWHQKSKIHILCNAIIFLMSIRVLLNIFKIGQCRILNVLKYIAVQTHSHFFMKRFVLENIFNKSIFCCNFSLKSFAN